MNASIKAYLAEMQADGNPNKKWTSCWLEVIAAGAPEGIPAGGRLFDRCLPAYQMMCDAILSDIQSAEASGASALEEIRQIEAGETDHIKADGNAWITHITRDKVWFEGLYGQGEGGEVSLSQYKLAVQTYVQFLADPHGMPVEVAFSTDAIGKAGQ